MFRFTIRDVLWLTVVVALSVGWGMNVFFRRSAERAWSEALAEEKWRCNELASMIEGQGYSVKCGPGRTVRLVSPQGWAISADGE